MTFYAKPSVDLVYDLINKANPGLPIPLSSTIARLDNPTPIAGAGPADLNTTVRASANRGEGYIGVNTLRYRRINLSDFFRSTVVIVNKYKAGGQPEKFSDYLDDFNVRYGFSLTTDDFKDVNFPAAVVDPDDNRLTSVVTVNTKADSFGFTGAFTFRWKDAPRELKNVIIQPELPGRIYPPSNFVNLLTYYGDNTAILSEPVIGTNFKLIQYFLDGLLLAGSARPDLVGEHTRFIDFVNAEYGTTFTVEPASPLSKVGNLYNAVIRMVNLPDVNYPTANNNYKHMLVLQLQPGHTWGTGDLFFHHNYGA